jgi:integrase/recombinase XerD
MWDDYTRCNCPLLIRGTLNRKRILLATSKFLPRESARSLDAARDLALLWEKEGKPVRPPESADPRPEDEPAGGAPLPRIDMAVETFLARGRDLGNSGPTLYKKRHVFSSGKESLLAFAKAKGLRFLAEINANLLQEWRSTWKVDSLSRHKRQCQVIGFLWFCERAGWLPRNFASDTTMALGKIKVLATQTGYFTPDEYRRILDATWLYSDRAGRPSIDSDKSLDTVGGDRIRALTELMRWTGLRIRDAVTLEKRRLAMDAATGIWSVMIWQRKTGDPVWCPIPPDVARMLLSVPASQKGYANETYFFWTGAGLPKTVVANWQRSYAKLFKLAGLKEAGGETKRAHPHMFRDTFAVESILAGMKIEDVSTILGHSSIRVTEKSYMPWVRARQSSLNQSAVNSWIQQGKMPAAAPPARARKSAAVIPISNAG